MRNLVALLFVASIVATTHCSKEPNPIHPLRRKTGSSSDGAAVQGRTCASWRLAVEAHNIIEWKTVPAECETYVGNYMLGLQYRQDSKAVNREAYFYARQLNLTRDGKNIWVFDVDETSLSNLPFLARNHFGVYPINLTKAYEWVAEGIATALPETLKLYNKLLNLGIKVVFITGRPESKTNITATNLKNVGYHTWHKLILKSSSLSGTTAIVYKSGERRKLEEEGYRIIGNIGDQWSDILDTNTGNRTFKLPNPLYYVS